MATAVAIEEAKTSHTDETKIEVLGDQETAKHHHRGYYGHYYPSYGYYGPYHYAPIYYSGHGHWRGRRSVEDQADQLQEYQAIQPQEDQATEETHHRKWGYYKGGYGGYYYPWFSYGHYPYYY